MYGIFNFAVTKGKYYIEKFKLIIFVLIPDLYVLLPENCFLCKNIYRSFIFLFNFFYNCFIQCLVDPFMNFFSLYLGGKKTFGKFLVFIVIFYISFIFWIIYTCLLPRRLHILNNCSELSKSNVTCDKFSEQIWICIHCVLGHIIALNVCFHYFSCIFLSPGQVPDPLPLGLPSATVCSRCYLLRPMRAHHCSICGTCVLRMDHHCPWTANCVGLYTHRHFYLVLVYMSFGGLYFLSVGWNDFKKYLEERKQCGNFKNKVNC